jgi:hypothetical protein
MFSRGVDTVLSNLLRSQGYALSSPGRLHPSLRVQNRFLAATTPLPLILLPMLILRVTLDLLFTLMLLSLRCSHS